MTISRFDQVVWLICVMLLGLSLALIARGDQVGLEIIQQSPADGSASSTRSQIRVQFNEELSAVPPNSVVLSPEVSGTTIVEGTSLVFEPDIPLQSGQEYEVTLQAGIIGTSGRVLREASTWRFLTTGPRILFIGLDEEAPNQIFMADPYGSDQPFQLSRAPGLVVDFAASPDGTQIAYTVSVSEEDRRGASDLWIMNADGSEARVLLSCGLATCSRPVWHPEGDRIVYERRTIAAIGEPPANPRLWWLDVQTRETVSVFLESQLLGFFATFSADGEWLSFVSPVERGIQLYNLLDGSGAVIRNRVGSPAVWSPIEPVMALADIYPVGESFQSLITTVDAKSGRTLIISEPLYDELIDDGGPAWSPDGQRLAFGRKQVLTASGRQLWIMRSNGADPLQLTSDPDLHHASVSWSPDGTMLLYQLFDIKELYAQTGIWVMDLGIGTSRRLYHPGAQPAWLP
ncbi:MAG: Ig-like domain-containing protein [Chloroflexota bacterium]